MSLDRQNHQQTDCIGILLTNLGTPDTPTTRAVRKYLREFLWDPRVVEIPRPLWWLILNAVVLPLRPRRAAQAYQKIWSPDGSPLLVHAKQQAEKLQQQLNQNSKDKFKVVLAMRYGQPSIEQGLKELKQHNATKVLVFPLYPQYSATTTASTFDEVSRALKPQRWIPELRMINQYADNPGYITAIVNSIQQHWQQHGKAEKLIFSFHGLPKRFFEKGDPYYCYCHKTARLVTEQLGLNPDEWQLTFQSRFGKAEWLQPYTDKTLIQLAQDGMKSVDVICPGFSADCLETLEEIDMRNREFFLNAGGENFRYIPALNATNDHIQALASLVEQHCSGW